MATFTVEEFVPGAPCSCNAMYGAGRRGQRYLTPAARIWRENVYYTLLTPLQPIRTLTAHAIPQGIRVVCTFVGVRGDADNYLKTTLDGLKLALGIDDRHFSHVEALVRRGSPRVRGAFVSVQVQLDGRDGRAVA